MTKSKDVSWSEYHVKHKARLTAKWRRWYSNHREQHIADVIAWQKRKKHEQISPTDPTT